MATNSNSRRNTGNNTPRNERDSVTDGFFDAFFSSQPTFTFFITVGTPTVDASLIGSRDLPLFISRYVISRIPENGEEETASTQFFNCIQELIENIRKKERLKKDLYKDKPYVYTKEMGPVECTVCLGEFKPKQHIRKLQCEHEFHKKCIDKWLLQGNSCCPLCRKEPFFKEEKK